MSFNRYIDLLITSADADFQNAITINMSFKSKVFFFIIIFFILYLVASITWSH